VDRHDRDQEMLAAEVWQRLFDFFMQTRPQRDLVLERLKLTPNDARGLSSLDVSQGKTMRALATEWGCDPSNATWMVDRLERRGLAERRAVPGDRRVKLVVLTESGAAMREALLRGMHEPPPDLLHLDRSDLEALLALLAKLPVPSHNVVSGSKAAGPRAARTSGAIREESHSP
jgi:DNA-binding MarR family transcriptional regulator